MVTNQKNLTLCQCLHVLEKKSGRGDSFSREHNFLLESENPDIKSSMEPQAYKIVSTHAHEISGWTILSRIIHSRAPHLGGMNGDVQSYLSTLAFKNGEQLEDFHIRILRLQQEIMLSREIVSPTRLLLQYMKALTNIDKLRAFIAPKMADLINLLDKNGNLLTILEEPLMVSTVI